MKLRTYIRLGIVRQNVVDLLVDLVSHLRQDFEGLEILDELLRLGSSQNDGARLRKSSFSARQCKRCA